MSDIAPLRTLVTHRLWIYGGGLVAILAARVLSVPRPFRVGIVGTVLAVMVLTYAGESLGDSTRVDRPELLVIGMGGIAVGVALALLGRAVGLIFLAGGLLFVHRALVGDQP